MNTLYAQNKTISIMVYITLVIILCVLGYFFLKKTFNHNELQIKITVLAFGIVFFIMETFKQIYYNINRDGYDWGIFPFQLCSTPIYFCLISVLFKEKSRDAIYAYLGSYAFLGGFSVMVLPSTVYTSNTIFFALSLIWHSLMIILALYLIIHHKFGDNFKQFFQATILFLVVTCLAMIMNYVFEQIKIQTGLDAYFNMFYISPYYESHVIIMKDIWRLTNWYVFIAIYIIGIPICSFILWKIVDIIRKKYNEKEQLKECHM